MTRRSNSGFKAARNGIFARAYVFAALLLLIGGYLTWGGISLLRLDGSIYYVVCGLALGAVAVLVIVGNSVAIPVLWTLICGTIVWAIWESGFDFWALIPRLALLFVLGAWLLLPFTRRKLPRGSFQRWSPIGWGIALGLLVAVGLGGAAYKLSATETNDPMYQAGTGSRASYPVKAASADPGRGEWQNWGNDKAGTRFSTLDQITPANVSGLKLAWSYRFGPAPSGAPGTLEGTPLAVGGRLFVCSDYNDVAALDAETGREIWRFRANVDTTNALYGHCRGVGYYRVPNETGACAERIYTNTIDARLIALDARDGKLCPGFGQNGVVNLREGLSPAPKGYYYVTSAPTVARGRLIIGGWIYDGQAVRVPSGVIRSFDAVTGKLSWAFDVGRPDRLTAPPPGEYYTRATPNSWAPMSVDEGLGLIYAPLGGAGVDYVGMHRRPFDEAWTTTVAAIDVETGRPRWRFQTVHHDLWDYDVSSQPTLIDWPSAGGTVPALIQPTKRGEIFVLDRRTGQPILPVTERRVPTAGVVPGERVSPTQPFSDSMPSFRGAPVTEKSMWGLSPLDQLWCRIKFREARYEGALTPPGTAPSIAYPGFIGGSNWGGITVDLDRKLMIVNTNHIANYVTMIPRRIADAMGAKAVGMGGEPKPEAYGIAPQVGAPYAVISLPFFSPLFTPCQQPPWGRISAIDLETQKLVWTAPLGTARDSGPLGIPSMVPFRVGTANLGGAVTTRSGLTFIGAAQDNYLRAIETTTGKVLWRQRLPASAQATPMTYRSQKSGRQFVVVAAGGHVMLNTKKGDHVLAYALPER